MNCKEIRQVLDAHRLTALSAAERASLDTHVAGCSSCADAVAVHDLLAGERVGGPGRSLLRSIVSRLSMGPAPRARRPELVRWRSFAAVAAACALLFVTIFAVVSESPTTGTDPATVDANQPVVDVPAAMAFVEGEHFVALPAGLPLGPLGDRVAAWVFFLWSCLHCYELEALLSEWSALPDSDAIEIIRVPVQWNPTTELYARAFYAAEALGVAAEINAAFFAAIHERSDLLATRSEIATEFRRVGVDRNAFAAVFESDEVERSLERARELASAFQIDATPTIVVDGVYKTTPSMAGSHERMLQFVEWQAQQRDASKEICEPVSTSRPFCVGVNR